MCHQLLFIKSILYFVYYLPRGRFRVPGRFKNVQVSFQGRQCRPRHRRVSTSFHTHAHPIRVQSVRQNDRVRLYIKYDSIGITLIYYIHSRPMRVFRAYFRFYKKKQKKYKTATHRTWRENRRAMNSFSIRQNIKKKTFNFYVFVIVLL